MSLDKQQINALFAQLAPHDGITKTGVENVKLMRASKAIGRTPVLYEPSIVIVCSGSKRGFLDNRVYLYDASHYLVLTVPLPFFTETEATADNPLLAISIGLDLSVIAELAAVLHQDRKESSPLPKAQGIVSTELNNELSNAVERLLMTLQSPVETDLLAAGIIKEIYYRVFIGEQGASIYSALTHSGQFGKIAKALRYIQQNYSKMMSIKELAAYCGLSSPAFHAHFKQITHVSPVQYIKSIRLQQARLMMIRDEVTAAYAAGKVGYESTTQFNREFKRLFGQSPRAEAETMKAAFSLQEAPSLISF